MNATGGDGGYSCAFVTCENISGRRKDMSFFRFPKVIGRSKLWVQACGRQDLIKKTSEELHKNYRVCALHFSQEMFLNDLRNRLQSTAVPITEQNNNTQKSEATPCNAIPQSNCQELEVGSDILLLDHLQTNTSNYVPNAEIQKERESKETQTGLTLSRNSPRKKLLKRRNVILQKKFTDCRRKKIQTGIRFRLRSPLNITLI